MSLDRRVLCARRSRHLREAPEHIDPPDDRTRQAGARPRTNPKRPWELMSRTQIWYSAFDLVFDLFVYHFGVVYGPSPIPLVFDIVCPWL